MTYPYQIKSEQEYKEIYQKSIENPAHFWEEIAEHFSWKKKWDTVLDWEFDTPKVEWFKGAKLNITENCLDRHLVTDGNTRALVWEPNNPDHPTRTLTYTELHREVCLFAEVLRNRGVKKGDRVCIYMGMVPELAVAALACARIGAIHSVIFGGFSAKSISDRVQDAHAEFIITADGAFRGKKTVDLKDIVDEALESCPFVKSVLVYQHTQQKVEMKTGRDCLWQEEMAKIDEQKAMETPAEEMDSEDPLFILYTSGSTGKPKGVVHTCGGYMVYTTYSFVNVFQYKKGEMYFCTADIGWITGHSYIVYGPLCAGATSLMFEGIPTYPDASRFWQVTEKHQVNILYTAPTAIRSLMSCGDVFVEQNVLSSLRVLGSVGEPINQEAWDWFNEKVGKGKCPIVDTWWQTETGGIMISNLAGVTEGKATFATTPLPGIQPELIDKDGKVITEDNESGNLCIKHPWPSTLRTTWGDHERCKKTYFSTYKGRYFTGDGCYRDSNGNYRITGRVDDVLNVSGHRIGTAELENAIDEHEAVIECAIVGYPHDIKGQGVYAYIICNQEVTDPTKAKKEINALVTELIGPIAKPDKMQFVSGLPKTRSGKIMRRILRKIAEGETDKLGDTSTLLDPDIVEEIMNGEAV